MQDLKGQKQLNNDYYLIDTHAHLDMLKKMTPENAVEESMRNGVKYIINVGSSIEGSKKSSIYAKNFNNVFASVGVHPHDAGTFGNDTAMEIETLIEQNKKIIAVGETGFDYFRNLSPKQKQKKAFISLQIPCPAKHH